MDNAETKDSIIASMGEGLIVVDSGRQVQLINPAAEKLLDMKASDFIGQPVEAFQYALARKVTDVTSLILQWGKALTRLTENPKLDFQVRIGISMRRLEAMLFPVGGNAGRLGTGVLLRDVTTEREVASMKDEFVSFIAHELRSPLTVIIGSLRTVISGRPRLSGNERSLLVEDAAIEAEYMSELIANLLDLTRAEANRLLLQKDPVNIVELLQNVALRVQKLRPGHRLTVNAAGQLPSVWGDRIRLERVVYNLMDNAAKYSPPGTTVFCSAGVIRGELVVRIRDQGPGIPAQDLPKLFQRFQRLDQKVEGAGIGLVVCRRLIEAHGGRVWAESVPGQGSTFYFALPLDITPMKRSARAKTARRRLKS